MNKYVMLVLASCVIGAHAKEVQILNETGGDIVVTGHVPQTINKKKYGNGGGFEPAQKSDGTWIVGKTLSQGVVLPLHTYAVKNGETLAIALPTGTVTQKLPWGTVDYDFSTVRMMITTSKKLGDMQMAATGTNYVQKTTSAKSIEVPVALAGVITLDQSIKGAMRYRVVLDGATVRAFSSSVDGSLKNGDLFAVVAPVQFDDIDEVHDED